MKKRGIFLFLVLLSMKVAGQPDCTIQTYSGDTVACYGEQVLLYTNFYDTLNYYWEPGGETGVILQLTVTEPVTCILHMFNDDSSFYCTDSITLQVHPHPALEIAHFPDPIPVHSTVTFSFNVITGDPGLLAYWEWTIGDSVFTNVLTPEYAFHDPGFVFIRLKYMTIDECWFYIENYEEISYLTVNEPVVRNFIISPNPATEILTFDFFLKNPANVELAIYNALGVVARQIIPPTRLYGQQNVTCNVGSMPPGLYYARLTIDNNSYTAKIVVK